MLGAETRVSGLVVRFNRGPCATGVCGPTFEDVAAGLAAASGGVEGATTGTLVAIPAEP